MKRMNFAVSLIFFFVFLIITSGCIRSSKNIEPSPISPIQTYICPDGVIVTNISECQKVNPEKTEQNRGNSFGDLNSISPSNLTSELSCPAYYNDKNSPTKDLSDLFKNYSGLERDKEQVCTNGTCQMILNESNKKEIVFLRNETKKFIEIVNNQRIARYGGKSILEQDRRLELVAEACAKEILEQNSSDLSTCYEKWGSFRDLLAGVGFYGERFFYLAECNKSSNNISFDIYKNLSNKEKALLVNGSINLPEIGQPPVADYIGGSIGCTDERCILVAITAGNRIVFRPYYDNWRVYGEYFLPLPDGRFIPQKYTLRILEASEYNPAWCKIFIYNLTNATVQQVSSNFWWSDWWEYANHGKNYEKRIDWTDYFSDNIKHPSVLYYWCYSTKEPTSGAFCGSTKRDRAEIEREFIDEREYTDEHVQKTLSSAAERRRIKNNTNRSVLEHINEKRGEKNLSKINYSKSLSTIAKSCAAEYLSKFDFRDCRERVIGNQSFSIAFGKIGIFGSWAYITNLLNNISDNEHYLDTISYDFEEFFFGDSSKHAEYIGYGSECEGGVCASMFIIGSNKEQMDFGNVRKFCGGVDCSYGLTLFRSYIKGCGNKMSREFLPNITLRLNSSVPAIYYFYKNKDHWSDVWENSLPKDGYEMKTDEYRKNYNITLPAGLWTVTYWPKVKDVEDKERLIIDFEYNSSIKVE